MSEMVERVALTLQQGRRAPFVELQLPMATCRQLARAAIGAMREPTEAMLDVACEQTVEPDLYRIDAAEQWRAMIDAALKD